MNGPFPFSSTVRAVESFRGNGIQIAYERQGEGPPLLFLVGSGSTVASMQPMLDVLAPSFDVAANDPRGLGESEDPPGPWTMADVAADALALADHLGWERFRVFGISFGGMVGQELAVTWPDRVDRLVLACTSPGGAGGASYPLHELQLLPPEEAKAKGLQLLDTRFTPEYLAEHPKDAGLAAMMAERGTAELDDEHRRGADEQMRTRATHDVWDRLAQITCPTLVACGRYDGIAPPERGEGIAARIPNADLRQYEGGHAFFVQDPTALAEITTFLQG